MASNSQSSLAVLNTSGGRELIMIFYVGGGDGGDAVPATARFPQTDFCDERIRSKSPGQKSQKTLPGWNRDTDRGPAGRQTRAVPAALFCAARRNPRQKITGTRRRNDSPAPATRPAKWPFLFPRERTTESARCDQPPRQSQPAKLPVDRS